MAENKNGGDNISKSLTYTEALKVLTPNEIKVLELAGTRYSGAEIAAKLSLSVNTVYKHKENIRRKLNLTGNGYRSLLKWYIEQSKP